MDFSRTLAALIASSGRATSMSFLLFFTPCPVVFAPSPAGSRNRPARRETPTPRWRSARPARGRVRAAAIRNAESGKPEGLDPRHGEAVAFGLRRIHRGDSAARGRCSRRGTRGRARSLCRHHRFMAKPLGLGTPRLPDGVHAPERLLDPRQSLPARVPADLDAPGIYTSKRCLNQLTNGCDSGLSGSSTRWCTASCNCLPGSSCHASQV